jgi:hypothetical protein
LISSSGLSRNDGSKGGTTRKIMRIYEKIILIRKLLDASIVMADLGEGNTETPSKGGDETSKKLFK